jgi:hypothetical protein
MFSSLLHLDTNKELPNFWLEILEKCCYSLVKSYGLFGGISSVGRASACQAEGRQFESGIPLHMRWARSGLFKKLFYMKDDYEYS